MKAGKAINHIHRKTYERYCATMTSSSCEFICPTTDRANWLSERTKGIGASEAAVVLGESPWKNPMTLWLEKTGQCEPDDLSGNEAVRWGVHLEEPIAQRYAELTGSKFEERNGLFRSTRFPWFMASPDRLVKGRKHGVEIKNVGWRQGANWTPKGELPDELSVPSYYRLQVAQQMAVMDYDTWDLCVLIGGQDFRIYELHRDKELEEIIIERERAFWKMVETRTQPPKTSDVKAYREFLAKRFAKHDDRMLKVANKDELILIKLNQLQNCRHDVAVAKTELIAAQSEVCAIIGDAAGIQFDNPKDGKITWKERNHTKWKNVAMEALELLKHGFDTDSIVKKHTAPGPRELRTYGKFFKIEGEEESGD